MDNRPEDKSSYLRVKSHLDDIAAQIRQKDLPLEKALDLYEEAIRLGNSCADLIDTTDFSLEELEAFNGGDAGDADDAGDGGEADAGDGGDGGEGEPEPQPQAEAGAGPEETPAPAPGEAGGEEGA